MESLVEIAMPRVRFKVDQTSFKRSCVGSKIFLHHFVVSHAILFIWLWMDEWMDRLQCYIFV